MDKRQQSRSLEEVLSDPSADWHEIRSCIKAQGSVCTTNAAIMVALSDKRSWATAAVATAIVLKDEHQEHAVHHQQHEGSSSDVCCNNYVGGCEDDIETFANREDEIITSSSDLPTNEIIPDECENNNGVRRSFRRRSRTGGLTSSIRRSGRRRGSRRNSGSFLSRASFNSINLMDFGVTEQTLDLSDSNRTGAMDKSLRDSGSDYLSNSFLGWNHDDRSVTSLFTHDRSIQLEDGSIRSEGDLDEFRDSLSNLVDSDGFLDWNHSQRRRSSLIEVVDEGEDETSCNETWNIEDYDGPDTNNTQSSDFGSTLSSLTKKFKRFGGVGPIHKSSSVDPKEEITTEDIKKALLGVRNGSEHTGQTHQPRMRRSTIEYEAPVHREEISNHKPRKKNPNRRQTIIGNVARPLLGLDVGNSNTERQDKNHLDSHTNTDCPAKKASNNRRASIIEGISPFSRMKKDQNEEATDTSTRDDREAIWINRNDGGYNIEKECRKLYSERTCHQQSRAKIWSTSQK